MIVPGKVTRAVPQTKHVCLMEGSQDTAWEPRYGKLEAQREAWVLMSPEDTDGVEGGRISLPPSPVQSHLAISDKFTHTLKPWCPPALTTGQCVH